MTRHLLQVQTTSIRLLMNLVEGIYHKHNQESEKLGQAQVMNQPQQAQAATASAAASEASVKGRKLLVRILDTFVRKFGTLKEYTRKLCEARHQPGGAAAIGGAAGGGNHVIQDDPALLLEFMPFKTGSICEISIDVTKEVRARVGATAPHICAESGRAWLKSPEGIPTLVRSVVCVGSDLAHPVVSALIIPWSWC